MVLLEASSALQNVYLIIAIIGALVALVTTIWGIVQKIRAGNWKGAAEDAQKAGKQLGDLLNHTTHAINKMKMNTVGVGQARSVVRQVLKNTGQDLEAAGLRSAMDAKLKELGLNDKS